jgi:hypothetical protein
VVPAQVEPIPRAMLVGDFKTRPHFLHLACSSILILLDKIHQPRRWIWAGVALEQRDLIKILIAISYLV